MKKSSQIAKLSQVIKESYTEKYSFKSIEKNGNEKAS